MGGASNRTTADAVDSAFATATGSLDRTRRRRALAIVKASLLGHGGETIGRYEIRGVLGRGGMGTVYRAWDPQLQRTVAVKLVGTRGDSSDERRRWLREGRALATVEDPHVVAVLDAGIVDDGVYVAMALVEGVTLGEWLAARSRSQREILDVFAQASRGLMAAHRRGIVHRDFKPDNVLVDGDGHAVLVDFGLARPTADAPTDEVSEGSRAVHTSSPSRTSVGGTPGYAAPEQMRGEPAGAASDQFSLCVALHEALTGRRPRAGELPDRGLPLPIRRLLARGLSADPTARWPDLQPITNGLGPRGTRRWPVAVAAVAAATVALFASGLVSTDPEPSLAASDTTASSEPRMPVDETLASLLERAERAHAAGRFAKATALLDPVDVGALGPGVRGRLLALRAKLANEEGRIHDAVADARAAVLAASETDDLRTELSARLALAFAVGVGLHDDDEALRVLRGAEAVVVRLGNDAEDRARVLRQRSAVQQGAGNYEAAAADVRRAIELSAPDADATGRMWQSLGSVQRHLGDYAASLASHDEALRRLQPLLGADHPDIGRTLVSRATTLRAMGRRDDAVTQFADGVARLEAHFGVDHPDLAIPLLNYGHALRESEALVEATAVHERYRRLVADHFAADDHAHVQAALTVAETRLMGRDYDGGLAAATEAAIEAERLLGDAHSRTAYAYDLAGQALGAKGEPAAARDKSLRALAVAEAAFGREHPGLVHYLLVASDSARATNDLDAARAFVRRASAIRRNESIRPDVTAHLEAVCAALGQPC